MALVASPGCTIGPISVDPKGHGEVPTNLEASRVELGNVTLGDAIFAFYLGPDPYLERDLGYSIPGYLVLIGSDGAYRTIKTDGMYNSEIAWSSANGLFFSDKNRDYVLQSDGIRALENEKPALAQQSAFSLGDKFVAIYNDGFTESGYHNVVTVTTAEGSEQYPVEGNYYLNTNCGDGVYGFSSPYGHSEAAAAIPELRSKASETAEPEMLARLYPPTDGGEEVVGWRPAFDATHPARHAPCVDDRIFFLAAHEDAAGNPSTVAVEWNTTAGEHSERILRLEDGSAIPRENFIYIDFDGNALLDGELEWLAGDGWIMSTNVDTGETRAKFDTGFVNDPWATTRIAFTDSSIHLLTDGGGNDDVLRYKELDRSTGQELSSMFFDDVGSYIGREIFLDGFAVRPSA